ncbi:hypothetical protein ACH5RR_039059 [Cinchona calisaya]|uniref:mitogen-activated protein kinase kinase n=1 Tax=Cinchona calisaya TaxID=153742 RepID=A0ABD2XYW8_9GENT
MEILKRLDSESVVPCHGAFENGFADKDGGGDLGFLMEYMVGGSLHDLLQKHHRLYEEAISGIARSVLKGLNYLHSMQNYIFDLSKWYVMECCTGHFPLINPGGKPDWLTVVSANCSEETRQLPETASVELQSFCEEVLGEGLE